MKRFLLIVALVITGMSGLRAQEMIHMERFGVKPDRRKDNAAAVQRAIEKLQSNRTKADSVVLVFQKGVYHFYPERAAERTYFVSNHDQPNPKKVGIALEKLAGVTLEGNGSTFIFHGSMLPIALTGAQNCSLRNINIDFDDPCIAQVRIVENRGSEGIVFKVEPWVKYKTTNNAFHIVGYDRLWKATSGIAFEADTKRVAYNTGDMGFDAKGIRRLGNDTFLAPNFQNKRLTAGMVLVLRPWDRPAPAIFLAQSKTIELSNVAVHHALGMGLLAQLCENIELKSFNVCLKGKNDPRYFTTQADATHFSQCRGTIRSVDGLYENMMDDAINVHGVYLKITAQTDANTVLADFIHHQAYGFDWAFRGDTVQFISSKTMDSAGVNRIAAIEPVDTGRGMGTKRFRIVFEKPLPQWDLTREPIGIENLSWTPEVYFARNTVRNNRARGALFSSPRKTMVEHNDFDHTSGTAILLCGDCNGWYESGACRDITIRENVFTNALTSLYQFTNAVISIYPEIPDLQHQQGYYHGGREQSVRIIDNIFNVFDAPILYAKSVDGLLFKDNFIQTNADYRPFHHNRSRFLLEHCNRVRIDN